MAFRNLIVVSKEDLASCNIKKFLLELGSWKEYEAYENDPSYSSGNSLMITIESTHLYYDNIDDRVEERFGFRPELVVYASRHRSKSGLKTLTLHPLGNYTDAKFGGIPGKLVPSAPRKMSSALRILSEEGSELEHQISFEATHHGPYLSTPTFFIEIGSDEAAWVEEPPAVAIAKTILKVLQEPEDVRDRVGIGIGGGHYVPRITDRVLSHHLAIGHMIPNYTLDMPWEKYQLAISKTPGADCVYIHKKSMKKSKYRELKEWCGGEGGLEVVDSKILEER